MQIPFSKEEEIGNISAPVACVAAVGDRGTREREGTPAIKTSLFISADTGPRKIPIGQFALGGEHTRFLSEISHV